MKEMRLFFKDLISLILLFFLVLECARVGSPTGGKKDETPPKVIREDPNSYSKNFDNDVIQIFFDEYIKFKDLQNELLISPPLKTMPQISPEGVVSKKIKIQIKDTLKPNITYLINFGNSITDNNEGNVLEMFKYIFSTGDYIDSLSIRGKVLNPQGKKIAKETIALLYKLDSVYNDSLPYKEPPYYISSVNDSLFTYEFSNISEGAYKLIILEDENKNRLFDSKTDKIGFLMDTINLFPTLGKMDTIIEALRIFKEIPPFSLKHPSLVAKNRIEFGYHGIFPDTLKIELLSAIPDSIGYRFLKVPEKDTLNFWFQPFKTDSLLFVSKGLKSRDTFNVRIKKMYRDSLVITPNQSNTLSLKHPFFLKVSTPISEVVDSLIVLTDIEDHVLDLTTEIDSINNNLNFDFEVLPNFTYKLTLFPNAIIDMFDERNDTLRIGLKTKSIADYGNLDLKLKNVDRLPIIIQLLGNQKVIEERYVEEVEEHYYFEMLNPGKYNLRVIYDSNKNKKWDTGNYLKKIYPEEIFYDEEEIELRANWDLDLNVDLLPSKKKVPNDSIRIE